MGSHHVPVAGLEPAVQNTLAANLWQSSCLSLQSAWIGLQVCATMPGTTMFI